VVDENYRARPWPPPDVSREKSKAETRK